MEMKNNLRTATRRASKAGNLLIPEERKYVPVTEKLIFSSALDEVTLTLVMEIILHFHLPN